MNPDIIGPAPQFTAEHRDLVRRGSKTQTRRVCLCTAEQRYTDGIRYMREPLVLSEADAMAEGAFEVDREWPRVEIVIERTA